MHEEPIEHLLRVTGKFADDTQCFVLESQSLYAQYPELPNRLCNSYQLEQYVMNEPERNEWPNEIGVDSRFQDTHVLYVDLLDEKIMTLPRECKGPLIHFESPASSSVTTQCLDAHDLSITKYVTRRERITGYIETDFAGMAH